tara:strand:- start:96 stop:401 length:306 start_codon:yes stop_codon:yes gene_type:complete
MADKDCKCLACEAERRWADSPHADALIQKVSELTTEAISLICDQDGVGDNPGDPITLMAWIGMALESQAQSCAAIMSKFDKLPQEEQDKLLDRLRDDLDSE